MNTGLGIQVDAWGAIVEDLQDSLGNSDWRPIEADVSGLDYIYNLNNDYKAALLNSDLNTYSALAFATESEVYTILGEFNLPPPPPPKPLLSDFPLPFMGVDSWIKQAQYVVNGNFVGLRRYWEGGSNYRQAIQQDFYARLKQKVELRQMINLETGWENVSFSDPFSYGLGLSTAAHYIFQQDIGDGGFVSVAVRANSLGNSDVQISMRVFERNTKVEFAQMIPTFIFLFFALVMAGGAHYFAYTGFRQAFDQQIVPLMLTAYLNIGSVVLVIGVVWSLIQAWIQYQKVIELRFKYSTAPIYQQFESRVLATIVNDSFLEVMDDKRIQPEQIRVIRAKQEEGLADLMIPREPVV